jgi:hemolysin D
MPKILNGRVLDPLGAEPSDFLTKKEPAQVQVNVLPADDWSDSAKEGINSLPQVWTRGLLHFLVLFAGIVLPWAMFSQIDETGAGRGRIEIKGTSNRLEASTAGAVVAVRVKEGQSVKKGEVLLELESDAVRSELQQAKTKLEGQMNRLSQLGIAKNQVTIAVATQQQQNKAQAVEKLAQIDQAIKTLKDSKSNLLIQQTETSAQLQQARQKLPAAKAALISARNKYQQSLREVKRYQGLWRQGGVSEVKFVEIKGIAEENQGLMAQAAAEVQLAGTAIKEKQGNYNKVIHQLQADIRQAESQLQEQQGNRASLTEGGKLAILKSEEQLKNLQSQISTLNTEATQTRQQIIELERQLAQKVVRAPVGGTILQLPFKQPKSFVQTGQLVAQIAPQGASTILKVQMPSQNTGFLRVGMPVKVKFDAYPFQDYGVVGGKVKWISPDSTLVEVGNTKIEAFEVTVVLEKDYIQSENKRIALTLGQTATAEMIVRQRRTIDMILDPFRKLQQKEQ